MQARGTRLGSAGVCEGVQICQTWGAAVKLFDEGSREPAGRGRRGSGEHAAEDPSSGGTRARARGKYQKRNRSCKSNSYLLTFLVFLKSLPFWWDTGINQGKNWKTRRKEYPSEYPISQQLFDLLGYSFGLLGGSTDVPVTPALEKWVVSQRIPAPWLVYWDTRGWFSGVCGGGSSWCGLSRVRHVASG